MNDSPNVVFTDEQQALLNDLVENWQTEADISQHCAGLCANDIDAAKLVRRGALLQICAKELKTVLDTGHLPLRITRGLDLDKMMAG